MLSQVSPERVRDEWFKILDRPGAADALRMLHQWTLLRAIVPQVAQLDGLQQPTPHRVDVLTHCFETVRAVERIWDALQGRGEAALSLIPDALGDLVPQIRKRYASPICADRSRLALLKCAALLHDVGKGETQGARENGRTHFIGHERVGAEMAVRWARRWRCSNAEVDMLQTTIEAHMRPNWLAARGTPTRRAVYRYYRDTGEFGVDAVLVSLADRLATHGHDLPAVEWRRLVETAARLLSTYYCHRETAIDPSPLISGHDLMEAFHLPPGRQIGDLLARIREEQAAGAIHTREGALARVQEWIEAPEEPDSTA
jgi:putative nucleotidyltransferase with HDIG domain